MIQDDGDTRPMTIYQPGEPRLWDARDVPATSRPADRGSTIRRSGATSPACVSVVC
jgi:hypothetical protein